MRQFFSHVCVLNIVYLESIKKKKKPNKKLKNAKTCFSMRTQLLNEFNMRKDDL